MRETQAVTEKLYKKLSAQYDKLSAHYETLRPIITKPAKGYIPYDYVVPGGFYDQLWDWDGFFISLHFAGRKEPKYMANWARTFIGIADENGWTPGCVTVQGRRDGIVGFQMKPFLAQGVELSSREEANIKWVTGSFDKLVKIVTLRDTTHCDAHTGLYYWDDAMQSGADNNPAIGNEDHEKEMILSCDINAYMWREYLCLATIATRIGHSEDAAKFTARAEEIKTAFIKHLWDAETGSCWNRHRKTGEWIKCVSFSNFVPLWAGMLPQASGAEMIEKYLWNKEHMLSEFGLRTLSVQDKDYNNVNMIIPFSNWQGPVWPIASYFYSVALVKYGFAAEAEELADLTGDLVTKDIDNIGSMHENYNAETGETLAPSADQPKGIEGGFIGWNLLVQDMFELAMGAENLLDLK